MVHIGQGYGKSTHLTNSPLDKESWHVYRKSPNMTGRLQLQMTISSASVGRGDRQGARNHWSEHRVVSRRTLGPLALNAPRVSPPHVYPVWSCFPMHADCKPGLELAAGRLKLESTAESTDYCSQRDTHKQLRSPFPDSVCLQRRFLSPNSLAPSHTARNPPWQLVWRIWSIGWTLRPIAGGSNRTPFWWLRETRWDTLGNNSCRHHRRSGCSWERSREKVRHLACSDPQCVGKSCCGYALNNMLGGSKWKRMDACIDSAGIPDIHRPYQRKYSILHVNWV